MSDLSGVLLFVLGFAGCVVALSGIILRPLPPRETLTDRWRKLTEELPKCL